MISREREIIHRRFRQNIQFQPRKFCRVPHPHQCANENESKSLFSISQHASCLHILRISSLIFLEIHTVFLRKIASKYTKSAAQSAYFGILEPVHIKFIDN